MANKDTQLDTMKQLQEIFPAILKEQSQNKKLLKAALSNPIFALESIGYKLSDSLKQEIENRARFKVKDQKKIIRLKYEIDKISKIKVNLSSTTSISNALKNIIKVKETKVKNKVLKTIDIFNIIATPLESIIFTKKLVIDPLLAYKNVHEIVPKLIEYRKIQASAPQLATKKVFNKILNDKTNKSGINIKNIRFVLQAKNATLY